MDIISSVGPTMKATGDVQFDSQKCVSHQTIHRFERFEKKSKSVRKPMRKSTTIRSKVNYLGITWPDYLGL